MPFIAFSRAVATASAKIALCPAPSMFGCDAYEVSVQHFESRFERCARCRGFIFSAIQSPRHLVYRPAAFARPPRRDNERAGEAMPTVFLDCDGVLADFNGGASRVLGMSPEDFQRRFGLKQFWNTLATEPDFFAELAPLPDARDLYEAVRTCQPVILTGLPRGKWAEPQKRRWAERHFPGTPMITTTAALKREHCRPGDALIDDWDTHRHRWEEAGGVFIHHRDAVSSIRALREQGFI